MQQRNLLASTSGLALAVLLFASLLTSPVHAQVVIDMPPPAPPATPSASSVQSDVNVSNEADATTDAANAIETSTSDALAAYAGRTGPSGTYYSIPWYRSNVQYGSYRYPYGYSRSIGHSPYVGVPIYARYGYGNHHGYRHHGTYGHGKNQRSYRRDGFDMNGSRRFGGHDFGASGRVRYDGDNVRVRLKF